MACRSQRSRTARLYRLGASAALAALVTLPQLVTAADADKRLPLGLYQIERESTMGAPDGSYSMHSKVEGASGTVVNRNRVGNIKSAPTTYAAPPLMHCVSSVNVWRMPTSHGTASQCTRQQTSVVDGRIEHRAVCPHGDVKLTVRQLDQRRWEYVTEVAMGSKHVAPNLMFLKPVLKDAIARAKTPQERAEAQRLFAELESQQTHMVDKRGETIAQLTGAMQRSKDPQEKETLRKTIASMGGTMPLAAVTREVWTRIADTCLAAPPK